VPAVNELRLVDYADLYVDLRQSMGLDEQPARWLVDFARRNVIDPRTMHTLVDGMLCHPGMTGAGLVAHFDELTLWAPGRLAATSLELRQASRSRRRPSRWARLLTLARKAFHR
jgi:hypothetical protein